MTTLILTDRLLSEALAPAPTSVGASDLARAVSVRTRATRQRRRGLALPWLASPAATASEQGRALLVRVAIGLMLLALGTGLVVAGAKLLPAPPAPPQWVLLRQGDVFSLPASGGERRALAAFAGMGISDVSLSWDGSRLATVRGTRNEILEVWDAASVFDDRRPEPVRYELPDGVLVSGAGEWRHDGRSILLDGRERGASRLYALDLLTGNTGRVSPDGVNVDDWQLAPNDRWVEIAAQRDGLYVLLLLDLTSGEAHDVMTSDGATIPVGGALGWAPDSTRMTVRLERNVLDSGVWSLNPDGSDRRRLTPEGQVAWSMSWSPDGAWIGYSVRSDTPCPPIVWGKTMIDTWVVRADGTEAHLLAPSSYPLDWADDSRSMIVESQLPLAGAPLGGVIHAAVDGSPAQLVYPYTELDGSGDDCHRYGLITKMYRGASAAFRK